MAAENILENLVRVGTVSSVNSAKRTARVVFNDLGGMVSGNLYVLQHSGTGVAVSDTELTYDVGGSPKTESHNHTAALQHWMPSVGQMVVCLYTPVFNGDGYILGGL